MLTDEILRLERGDSGNNIFVPSQWIGKGQPYPADPPDYLSKAYEDAFAIPTDSKRLLPGSMTSIYELVSKKIPQESSTIVAAKSDRWFSPDTPTTELSLLLDRPLPPRYILEDLRRISTQKWLDGMQSVRDPRHNHGTERFPLYALTFWEALLKVTKGARSWRLATAWLDSNAEHVSDEHRKECRTVLRTLGWNEMMHGVHFEESTLELTRILGSAPELEMKEWLSIGNVSLMLDRLRARLAEFQPNSKTLLPSPALMNELLRPTSDSRRRLSEKLAAQVLREGTQIMYIVVHVDMSHWVAVRVNIVRSVIEYGMFISVI